MRYYPAIVRFLGYNPLPEPGSCGEAVYRERLTRGLSQAKLADLAGVDEGTIRRIEADTKGMARRATAAVLSELGLNAWMKPKNQKSR